MPQVERKHPARTRRNRADAYLLKRAIEQGRIVVTLVDSGKASPNSAVATPVFGRLAGRLRIAEDFDETPDDIIAAMER